VTIEFGDPLNGDSSEVRPAISYDGTKVYAVFNRITSDGDCSRMADVVVVRDDHGGDTGKDSFTALKDSQGQPGLPVVTDRTFAWNTLLGGDRTGGDLAIAVDPRNGSKVYLVWTSLLASQPTLHVTRSDDAGQTWTELSHKIKNAKNPAIAVSADGTLGFLYQQVIASPDGTETWYTNLERTKDDFNNCDRLSLATFPVSEMDLGDGQPKLGDYVRLLSVNNNFYGIFSSKNVPDDTRFPYGVSFQRRVDRQAKVLLGLDGKPVDASIDPFFFRVSSQQTTNGGSCP